MDLSRYPIITSENGSKQPMFLAVMCALLLLSTCVVSARFWCRYKHAKIGIDDYTIGLALAVALTLGIMNGFHISYGAGTHPIGYTKKPEIAYIPNLKHWYAYQMVYPLSLALVKASFLALYYRIFPPPIINRCLFWGVGTFIAVYTAVIIFVNAFECPDPSDAWKVTFPRHSPQCNDVPTVYYTMAGINILTDLFVLALPIHPALHLNVNKRKKYAIVGIFLIGSIAVFASCLRVYFVWIYITSKDPAFDTIEVLLWSQIELNVAIICASIASLRPLFKSVFVSSASRSRSRSGALRYNSSGSKGLRSSQYNKGIELVPRKEWDHPISKAEAILHSLNNDSQEYILSKDEGIKRTIETSVTSEEIRREDEFSHKG